MQCVMCIISPCVINQCNTVEYLPANLSPDSSERCPVVRRLDPSDVPGGHRVGAAWWWGSSLTPAEHPLLNSNITEGLFNVILTYR